jgi:NAD(P)-dependent dehydrogenase (short-subunit alcohol dehydrogenase family)
METTPNTVVNKTILITGATSGLGLVTATELGRQRAHLVLVGRNPDKTKAVVAKIQSETGNSKVDYLLADFSSLSKVRALARQFRDKYSQLDVLINNAGGVWGKRTLTEDGLEMTIGVNHVATFLLTKQLLDLLTANAQARIVNVASEAHRFGKFDFDNLLGERRYGGYWQYCRSKLMNLLFTYDLARQLQGTGVTVNALHPGWAATNIAANYGWKKWFFNAGAFLFGVSAEKGARTEIYLASSPEVAGISGKYFAWQKEIKSSKRSYDEDLAKRLWQWTTEMASRGA